MADKTKNDKEKVKEKGKEGAKLLIPPNKQNPTSPAGSADSLASDEKAYQHSTGSTKGFAPFAPVLRAGHYDHIPESLQPADKNARELIPRNPLEKSSSSFLRELHTPPDTDSEDEAGQMGLHMLCFGRKAKHHVDKLYRDERQADRLGYILLFFVILSHIPTLILQFIYVFAKSFRTFFLENYPWTIGVFFFTVCLSVLLKYFTGVMRRYPYNVIMCVVKSLVFAIFYTTTAAYTEFLLITALIKGDPGYDENNAETWEVLFPEYIKNEFEDDPKKNPHGIHSRTVTFMFLYGIAYGIVDMILMMFIVKYSKVSFFGAAYPFISYTITFSLILLVTLIILAGGDSVSLDINGLNSKTRDTNMRTTSRSNLWKLGQAMLGPVIGCVLTEMYVRYLDKLLSGKMCPLKAGEFAYAMAHY